MLEDLKLDPVYDGFLFLAESIRNPPSLRSHHHVELELNLVVQGAVTYICHGERITFPRRSLIWMFPAQEHQLVDRTKDAQYYVAVFKPNLINHACRGAIYKDLKRKNMTERQVLRTILDPRTFDFLSSMMEHIMEGSLDPDILNHEAGFGVNSSFKYRHDDPDALNAGLRHLLLYCWRLQQTGKKQSLSFSLHPSISKAIEILSNNSWDGSLAQLARKCGLSESHFSRMFTRQVGVPLNRYRNSLRLARFWERYRAPAKPTILEAVYDAGFGSYAQFYKVFAEAYGQGPRACMKMS